MRKLVVLFLTLLVPSLNFGAPGDLTPEQIIREFAAKESKFRDVWAHYTYTQHIRFEVLGPGDTVRERRVMDIEVYFTNDGKRHTRVTSDWGALHSVSVTPEDISDAINLQPFVLTTEELPSYKIKYKGTEHVDELDTYVFDVEPHKMKKGKRYFKGRIWVDQLDLQIVKTKGRALPQTSKNKFPEFETIRQQIDGKYWFPTWTEADDILRFGDFFSGYQSVHIHELITYENFKKFDVSTTIKYGGTAKKPDQPPR